jgi:hypothetical protein
MWLFQTAKSIIVHNAVVVRDGLSKVAIVVCVCVFSMNLPSCKVVL